jgi:hypothetical protein
MFGTASLPVALQVAPASSAATKVGRPADRRTEGRMIAESRQALRVQWVAVVLVPVPAAVPFTDAYGRTGALERLLYLGAVTLAVLALALLLAPVVARVGGRSGVGSTRVIRAGVACLYLAALGAGLLIVDLTAT